MIEPYIIAKLLPSLVFLFYLFLYLSSRNNIKVYIGYLPINIREEEIKTVFQPFCQVANVIIKKGNAQGTFDKFCYGFVSLACDEKKTLEVIAQVERINPGWKMKIKDETMEQRDRFNNVRPNNMNNYPPNNYHQPMNHHQMPPPLMMSMHNPQQHQMRPNFSYGHNQAQNDIGEIRGQKTNKIIVRQLWLGGIPQLTDHNYMKDVMSRFGQVEATEIFPKFAFVKFKKALDATIAYQRAHMIYQIFGENSGFRIAFSDPSRRKDIVANHYQFERMSVMLPILFLGFPPITSAKIDLGHMLNICQKFGPILNHYMKKSTNAQMRSYFLFTYDSVKTALRAKQELCRRKDLLSQKRVEITLLLDENSILQGHDFSYTEKHFLNEQGGERMKRVPYRNFQNQNQNQSQNPNPNQGYPPPPANYQQHNPNGYPPQMPYPQGNPYFDQQNRYGGQHQQPFYYPPQMHQPKPQLDKKDEKSDSKQNQDVLNLLHSVLDEPSDKKPPQKDKNQDGQNAHDIISKILGVADPHEEEGELSNNQHNREPNWAGFLTWRGTRRTGVDGYIVTGECELVDYNINISSVMDIDDVILKDKAHMMILEPTNKMSQISFNDYLRAFKKKAGVSVTKNWLIYLIGKCFLSDKVHKIKENELLLIMEKVSLVSQIKDKTQPCDDMYFE